MATTQTQLPPPAIRASQLSESDIKYLFMLQYQMPLRLGDSTAAPYSEALPQPGVQTNSDQTSQNQELIYCKIGGGANAWTITGAVGGNVVIASDTFPNNIARFKSNASNWYRVG